jgi:hypothetical protein
MAVTKAGMRKQVVESLAQVAPPGEQFVACVHGMTGPSPWIDGAFGAIGALITQSVRKYYFVTLTNTSIVVNRAGRIANRPKEIVLALPLQPGTVTMVKKNAIWSKLYLQFPGEAKPTKIHVHRIWNADLDAFLATVPVAQIPAQGSAPVDQQVG